MGGDEEEERGTGKIELKGEDGWGGGTMGIELDCLIEGTRIRVS